MSSWRDYADQVEVAVLTVEDQLSEPSEVWAVRLAGPPARIEEFEHDVQRLAFSEELRADRPHILTSRRTYYSWGADAVGWQHVLEIAAHYGDAALTAAITYQFTEWWKKRSNRGGISGSIDKEVAESTAFWAILLGYKTVRRDDLKVVSEEHDAGMEAWAFEIVAPGHKFTVKVGAVKGVPTAVNIRCQFDD